MNQQMPRRGHFAVVKSIRTAQRLEYKLIALNKGKHMPDSAQQDFLKDLEPEQKTDAFDQPLTPEPEKVEEQTEEVDEEEVGNRRERRLRAQLQAERESGIELAARLSALTEAQKFSRDNTTEIDETIARIYGTNTPEAAEATALLQKALRGAEDRATERALEAFREEQQREANSVRAEETKLEGMIEDIEDTYNVRIDAQTEKGFFSLLERLSPKDRDGNIIEYADSHAVWEELQSRKAPANTRAKDLAARSMVKQGASPDTSAEDDATVRFLKQNGII